MGTAAQPIASTESELLKLEGVAQKLGGVSIFTVRREIDRGHLRPTYVGARVFVAKHELERYIVERSKRDAPRTRSKRRSRAGR